MSSLAIILAPLVLDLARELIKAARDGATDVELEARLNRLAIDAAFEAQRRYRAARRGPRQ